MVVLLVLLTGTTSSTTTQRGRVVDREGHGGRVSLELFEGAIDEGEHRVQLGGPARGHRACQVKVIRREREREELVSVTRVL